MGSRGKRDSFLTGEEGMSVSPTSLASVFFMKQEVRSSAGEGEGAAARLV